MGPRKGNSTRADDKGDEVHDSSQSLYIGRIRKKRRSREQAADERFFGRMTAELKESKVVLLVWGAFCTMLTVSSAIDPLGGEMVRQDRSVPVVTGNTFIKE